MKLLSQMIEEELKTLFKSFETSYCEGSTVTIKQSDFNNMWSSIDGYAKENKRLWEQLNDANEVIKTTKQITGNIDLSQFDYEHRRKIDGIIMQTESYLEKWGVK